MTTKPPAGPVFMRPPNVIRISPQNYSEDYWPKIAAAIAEILANPTKTVSQEEMYRTIYNVCCQRHNITLYNDLLKLLSEHLSRLRDILLSTSPYQFLPTFAQLFLQYQQASQIICICFKYLDRIYVTEKLSTSLTVVLNNIFNEVVLEQVPEIKQRLQLAIQNIPLPADPSLLMNLVKGLYGLDKEYANCNPAIFSLYIPCLRPTRGLEQDARETMEYVSTLCHQGFPRKQGTLKRKYEDTLTT